MTPHSRALTVAAAALVPVVACALAAAAVLINDERQATEREAISRARGAMTAVDAHLRGSIVSLGTLASSKNLEAGDIRAFHQESQRVLGTQTAWVNIGLISSRKMQLSNAVEAFGRPESLPLLPPEDDSFEIAVRTGRPAIGNVAAGNVVTSPTVRVRYPVTYGEEVRYVMSAPLNLRHLAALLEAQRVPADWALTLLDRRKHVIVRHPQILAAPAGVAAPDSFGEAIGRSPEGWFRNRAGEGRQTYTAYVTSEMSGWVLGISIPVEAAEAGERRIYALVGGGLLAALAAVLLLAWLMASRLFYLD